MGLSKEEEERILKGITGRIGPLRSCAVCGYTDWSLGGVVAYIIVSDSPPLIQLDGPKLPAFPLTCNHCGNTHFLNAKVLGLSDLIE
jgi:hypothetical protein